MRSWSSSGDPGTGVRDGDQHLAVLLAAETSTRPPCGRELDRVREQVEDDLADAALVSFHQVDRGVELELELRRRS